MSVRILRLALPAGLVAAAEQAVARVGYPGMTEFVSDAIQGHLAQLEADEGRPEPPALPTAMLDQALIEEPADVRIALPPDLGPAPTGSKRPLARLDRAVPLGALHNRTFPTLWAAGRLVAMCQEMGRPVAFRQFVRSVLGEAWIVGAALDRYQRAHHLGFSASARWPTNASKQAKVEASFTAFVLGEVSSAGVRGPLFALGLAHGFNEAGEAVLAPTPEGIKLLQELEKCGVTADYPHPEAGWEAFSSHVWEHAGEEALLMMGVLQVVAKGPRPPQFEDAIRAEFRSGGPDLDAMAAAAPGYLARAREWGLVEPRAVDGRYALTDLGSRVVKRGLAPATQTGAAKKAAPPRRSKSRRSNVVRAGRSGPGYRFHMVHQWRTQTALAGREGQPCNMTRGRDLLKTGIEPGETFVYILWNNEGQPFLLGGFPVEDMGDDEDSEWGSEWLESAPEHASLLRLDRQIAIPELLELRCLRRSAQGGYEARPPVVRRLRDGTMRLDAQTFRRPTLLASGWEVLDRHLDWGSSER